MGKDIAKLAVIAVVPVEHDLVRSEPGDEFELTEAQAGPLLAVGAIKLKEAAAEAETAVPATKTTAKK